jgi:hypothetical protein
MDKEFLRRLRAALEEIEPTLDAQNDVPVTAKLAPTDAAEAQTGRQILTQADTMAMRRGLKKFQDHELMAMFREQASKRDTGIPLDAWVSAGGRAVSDTMNADPTFRRLLDTTGATPLIRQDLEPILYELYIREFPAWERFAKEPSNGLVHAYNRQTGFGDAVFMTELGTVTDDVAAYERATTPVSIIATRRGVSIKSQWGTLAGGAGFNPEELELRSGLRAIAHRMQKTIFEGNASVSGGTSSTEDGAYDANAFDGLRKTLNTSRATQVDPFAATPEDIRSAINEAAVAVSQNAGRTNILYMNPETKRLFDEQQDANVQIVDRLVNRDVGVTVSTVNTSVFGALPIMVVPGDSISTYVRSAQNVADIYMIDESAISLPFLGSDSITTLEIPVGVSGQLTRLFIMFGMWGLAVKAVQFHNKVRVHQD